METRVRSLVKAASWQLLGLVTMSILGFLFTGSLSSGSALAAASGLLGFFTYLAHERVWAGVRWGWISATGTIREAAAAEQ